MKDLAKKAVCEFLGATAIVLFGCGLVAFAELTSRSELLLLVPFVFGAVVCLMIYAFGQISGGHFNPAVTIAFASVKKHPWKHVPIYMLAQIAGAIFACALMGLFMPGINSYAATTPQSIAYSEALFIEVFLAFVLMFVIKTVSRDSRAAKLWAAPVIGLTIFLGSFLFGSLTGASMNPARSIGPALFEQNLSTLWIYIVGPVIGAILGAKFSRYTRCVREVKRLNVSGCC